MSYRDLISEILEIHERTEGETRQELVTARWDIGRRIVQEEQRNKARADYGTQLVTRLADDLSAKLGNGYSQANLYNMRLLYKKYRKNQLRSELGWSHYRALLRMEDELERRKLEKMAILENLSGAQLAYEIRRIREVNRERSYEHMDPYRGKLNTRRIVKADRKNPRMKGNRIDLGFTIWLDDEIIQKERLKEGDLIYFEEQKTGRTKIKKTEGSSRDLYTYLAIPERAIDGDTLLVYIVCGFGITARQRLQLRHLNAEPIDTTNGKKAMNYVQNRIKNENYLIVKTFGRDAYDRYLADVYYLKGTRSPEKILEQGEYLNRELLEKGLVFPVVRNPA